MSDSVAETFTGQMTWPCTCGHPKGDHYFGDNGFDFGPAGDGRMHTWCQRQDECADFTPAALPSTDPTAALAYRIQSEFDLRLLLTNGNGHRALREALEALTPDGLTLVPTGEVERLRAVEAAAPGAAACCWFDHEGITCPPHVALRAALAEERPG